MPFEITISDDLVSNWSTDAPFNDKKQFIFLIKLKYSSRLCFIMFQQLSETFKIKQLKFRATLKLDNGSIKLLSLYVDVGHV